MPVFVQYASFCAACLFLCITLSLLCISAIVRQYWYACFMPYAVILLCVFAIVTEYKYDCMMYAAVMH